MVAWAYEAQSAREEWVGGITKGQNKTLGDIYVHNLDCGYGFVGMYTC